MSNKELENAQPGDGQRGSKGHQSQRRSPGAVSKSRQSKGSGTRTRSQNGSKKKSQTARAGTKQDSVIRMLRRESGVSIDDIIAKTKWQPHSVRGFFSGIVRKKLKLALVSDLGKDGVRRYHVAPIASSKA